MLVRCRGLQLSFPRLQPFRLPVVLGGQSHHTISGICPGHLRLYELIATQRAGNVLCWLPAPAAGPTTPEATENTLCETFASSGSLFGCRVRASDLAISQEPRRLVPTSLLHLAVLLASISAGLDAPGALCRALLKPAMRRSLSPAFLRQRPARLLCSPGGARPVHAQTGALPGRSAGKAIPPRRRHLRPRAPV